MPPETTTDPHLAIAHVLFTDIVGYSKLLTNEQRELLQQLNKIIRDTEQFRFAEAADKLVRLPTGDGMALAFFTSPDAPVRCALAISKVLKDRPQLRLRMGIHSGPVDVIFDVNDRRNVAGAGINMAQRVMDCGDGGHILLSKRVADDLAQYSEWKPYLHDLGEVEVKHGVRVNVVNCYNNVVGNAELPGKLKKAEQDRVAGLRRQKQAKRRRTAVVVVSLLALAVSLGVGSWIWKRRVALTSAYKVGAAGIIDKSIAVLPFENFNEDKENAYFADGVQDDILTDLAKVADLKVISRRSVAQYRGSTKGIREIGEALQVAYVLEGTVRRVGNTIRITAQLIDTRTEVEKWAEKYERDLADVFAIQSQISQTIVAQLKAALSPTEKSAIETRPTEDLEAYDLYLRARAIVHEFGVLLKTHDERMAKAEEFLAQAIARDPKFVLAYCLMIEFQLESYWREDKSPERLAKARAAADAALQLAPDSGELHAALVPLYYDALKNKKRGEEELAIAARKLPNSVEVASLTGNLAEDRGDWKEALIAYQKRTQLDPRDPEAATDLVQYNIALRRYGDAEALADRAMAGLPPQIVGRFWRQKSWIASAKGDTKAAMAALDAHPMRNDGLADLNLEVGKVLILERKYAEAAKLIESLEEVARAHNVMPSQGPGHFNKGRFASFLALALRADGQLEKARATFETAKHEFEEEWKVDPESPFLLGSLAVADAGAGRKEEALQEAKHALEVWPETREPRMNAIVVATDAAVVYAWTGDHEAAIQQLQRLVRQPWGPTAGDLKLNPRWDELRGDSRFPKLIADAALPVEI